MTSRFPRASLGLLGVLLLPLALSACNEARTAPSATEAKERPVLVAPVTFEGRLSERTLVGVIRPRVETDLGFRVAGKVSRRLVEVGQPVRQGDALAELDTADLAIQREQAEAELRAATGSVVQATAEEKRLADLRTRGWAPDSNYDRQKAALDEAIGRRDRAHRALALAENALSYATLRADADGVVTAASIEPGQVVAAGQAAIRVAHDGEREALVAVPEAYVERVAGAQARVTLWSDEGRSYPAALRELSPVADPATRTYAARFTVRDAGPALKLGMTATVTLSEPGKAKVARLPLSALYNQGQGPSLWVVDKATGAVVLRPVEVAGQDGRDVLVASGVKEGELVVALGVHKIDPGARVRVVSAIGL
ncbi:efflux RND transporter periplasmic adaptor subunit [Alsobacter sp. R-9]